MHAASDIALGVVLAPAAAATALQGSVAQSPDAPHGTAPGPSQAGVARTVAADTTAGVNMAAAAATVATDATPAATPASPAAVTAPAGDAATTSAAALPTAHAAPFVPAPQHAAITTQAGTPAAFDKATSPAGAVGGTVFALVFVVGLILALAWLARRMPGVAGSSNRALRVVASLSLGPREKVVVVDVGGQQLLLGVGAGGTRALHTLAAPLPEPERTATPAFAQLLAQHFGKKA